MRRSLILLSLLITIAITASGQVTRGSLTGLVNDSTGAVVPNAKVAIKNDATSVELSAATNSQGSFVFPSLDPGKYTVTIEASGFKRAEVKDVVIQVSTPATISVILEIGQVSEAVVISGESQEVINTTSPTLTNVINTRQVQDLPIAGRNPMDLARLQAGIAVNGTNTRTASVGGLRGSATNIEQDGINAMDNFVKTDSFFALTAPSINSTSEFSVTVGTVGSDAGRGVAQVRLVTPSGSNQIHGAAFWEHHNDFLNANTFFNNLNNTPRTIIRQNYFGGSLSGPIFLPRFGQGGKAFIDERNKGFWFFSYEGFREPFSVTRNRTVLTAAARQGQFSYVGSNGQTQTVDLLSIGNAHSLNPITMAKLNAMPASNNTLVGDGLNTAGFQYNVPGKDPNNKYNFRIDQNLFESQKWGSHKLEVDYHRGSFLISPDTFNSNEAPFPGNTNAIQSSIRTLAAAAIQSTFGSNITNEVRFGHQRAPVGFLREAAPTDPFFITFQSGVTNYDLQFMSQGRNTIVYQFLDNFSLVKGTHTFRTGFDFQSVSAITFNDAGLEPTVTLGTNSANSDGIVKGDFPLLPSGSTGDAIVTRARNVFADITGFLGSASRTLNIVSPDSGFVPGATRSRDFKQREFSLYFQDQWKIKRNFTFNYGTRWEYEGVPYEIHGLAIQPSNGIDGLYGISGPGNLFNPGVLNGQPTTSLDFVNGKTGKKLYNNDWNNFAPFVGLAYSPNFEKGPMKYIFGKDGKSSIRAGYSISYLHDGFTVVSNALGTGTTNPGLIQTAANTTPVGVLTGAGVPLTIAPFQIPITD
ncbi:MAG: TonB-dependent receptor, partial [Blastocatellia bacterium]|nr:TonB-dependent receptor [Blastocatellia bacterium]